MNPTDLKKFAGTVISDFICSMKAYPGQKKIDGLYHKIINEIPVHERYYELFAGSAAIATLLTVPFGRPVTMFLNDRDRSVTDRLNCTFRNRNVKISTRNVLDIVQSELTKENKKAFAFLDPTYLHSTRPNNTKLYNFEMSDSDHVQLLRSVLQLKCNVMIIHPKCELYDKHLKNWRQIPVKVRYHNKTSQEILYMNYEKPAVLHMDNYLGKDCWDRQRIKRKGERFVSKLAALPEHERRFILQRVIHKFN